MVFPADPVAAGLVPGFSADSVSYIFTRVSAGWANAT